MTKQPADPFEGTLADLILERASSRDVWLILPKNPLESDEALRLTFADVCRAAKAVAHGLQASSLKPGEAVLIMADNSAEFPVHFFGAILAGGVPVPVPPPQFGGEASDYWAMLRQIIEDTTAFCLVLPKTFEFLRDQVVELKAPLHVLGPGSWTMGSIPDGRVIRTPPDSLALIQYTSGSTRSPRGAMLTHRAVLANVEGIGRAVNASAADVAVCWLPLYHDMGLSGLMLYSWYWGMKLVLSSPLRFISDPSVWLWSVSRFGGTSTAAPNFAYALCSSVRKVPNDKLRGVDLSSWRVAVNAAEAVQKSTVDAFCERYAPVGFDARSILPVYGMAENVVACCFPPYGEGAQFQHLDPSALDVSARVVAIPADRVDAKVVARVGVPLWNQSVRICGTQGETLGENRIGHIQIAGASLMAGYCRQRCLTEERFTTDGWLRTGDEGYVSDGHLYVTGRQANVMKIAGRRLYAEDVEAVVGAVPGVRAGCVAAFGVDDPMLGTQALVVVAETNDDVGHEVLKRSILGRTASALGVRPSRIEIWPRGAVPKTTSGKVQSNACREMLLSSSGFGRSNANRSHAD